MKGVVAYKGCLGYFLLRKRNDQNQVSLRDTKYLNGMRIEVERETESEQMLAI